MAKQTYKNGITSVILRVAIQDVLSVTGEGLAGLAFNSSGLVISTIADNEASATTYTAAGSTIETITTLGTFAAPTATKCRFKEVDSTNHKGLYEIHIADARWAVSGARSVIIEVYGATNAARVRAEVQLMVAGDGRPIADANSRVDIGKWIGSTPNVLQSGRVDSYIGAIASAIIAAASFAAGALDAVWSTTTRLLSAGTNIVLAKGTGITGFNDLDAAGVRSAVGLASANLDTQLTAIDDYLDTEIATLIDAAARMLGLQGKHVRLESPTFDGDNNILTYTLKVYDTGAHATAGGATGLLYQYSVTNTYSGGNLATSVTTQVS